MRLDHLLSKEEESSNEFFTVLLSKGKDNKEKISGGDALKGNTRPHPEHEG